MSRRLRARWTVRLAAALFGFSAHVFGADAAAPAPRVALEFKVDPALADCPTLSDLTSAVSQQLGYDPFVAEPGRASHRVRASIDRSPAGTQAHVEWLDARGASEGERRLGSESTECAEIARGLAFAIAVQIQLRAAGEPKVEAVAPPAPAPQPMARKPAAKSPSESRRVIMAGAGILASHGLTPGVSPGLRLFGSFGNARLSLEVSAQATWPSERGADWTVPHLAPGASGPSFTARELSSRLSPCVRISLAGVCGVFMLGQLHVRGDGVDQVRSPSSFVAAAGGKLQLLWPPLPSFGILLQAEALALLTPRDVLLNRQIVWSTAPILLGASLDLAAIFR